MAIAGGMSRMGLVAAVRGGKAVGIGRVGLIQMSFRDTMET